MNKFLKNSLEAHFNSSQWVYDFDEERNLFKITFNLSGKIKSVTHVILVGDDEYRAVAYPDIVNADKENINNIAEYLHRINSYLGDGRFEIDFDTGEIRFYIRVGCTNNPEEKDFQRFLGLPEYYIENYGEGMLAVMFGFKSPKDAAEES